MPTNLVIVESPTKAKTIARFLGKGWRVESSFGHIRDLPKSKIGIDIKNDFTPQYEVPKDKEKTVTALKKAAAKADSVYFATDEDREGEAISWHLAELLGSDPAKLKRITFHEITAEAIKHAFENPRELDLRLVDAQQARRVLDRLVGYELSPFLWKKVARGLSAGRVQSVALRLIVEREQEISAFKPQEYWTIEAIFATKDRQTFPARLAKIDGQTLEKFDLNAKAKTDDILQALAGATFTVADVTKKEVKRNPLPPYTTSTLQQDANRRLGYSARQTMRIAQQLYEGVELPGQGSVGLITYMRTDSVNLSEKFIREATGFIKRVFGDDYPSPKTFKTKSKGAQEAHEAIRPTDVSLKPDDAKTSLDPGQTKLYDLIWRRAVASQMAEARLNATTIDIANDGYVFRATGQVTAFPGYLKIYPDSIKETELPKLSTGDAVEAKELKPEQHFTEPPARYSEAGLVKKLEENGIGRPSTYAPTIATIIDRGYVLREERRLKSTDMGTLVTKVLIEHFPEIVDYSFTAKMEESLDEVAEGTKPWVPVIRDFYEPFKKHLTEKTETVSKKELTEEATDHVCEKCGKPMVIKMGRFGKFLACTGYPDCKNTKPLNGDGSVGSRPEPEKTGEKCPQCGAGDLMKKVGRFGPFISCSRYPDCKYIKNIEKKTGVTCPQCGKGDIIEKRSRYGKTFYSCNRYPDCKFALWSKPTGEKCPESGGLMVYGAKGTVRCSDKGCKYKREGATEPQQA